MSFLLDPNELLLMLVGVWSCASLVQALLRVRRGERPREALDVISAVLLVIGISAVTRAFAPTVAGYVAGLLWAVLVAFPLFAWRLAFQRAARRDFRGAQWVSRLVAWLRPLGGWEDAPAYYRASQLLTEGRREEALALLDGIDQRAGGLGIIAASERFIATGDWEGFRVYVEAAKEREGRLPPALLARYLRALGETGDLDGLLATVDGHLESLWRTPEQLQHAVLFAFAFAGRVPELEALLGGPLRSLDRVSRDAWLATAQIAAGEPEIGRTRLLACAPRADAAQRVSIERRLEHPPRLAQQALSPLSASRLRRLIEVWDKAQRYLPGNAAPKLPIATLGLALILVLWFFAEVWFGGSTRQDVLLQLGAMNTERVLDGEWWRVITAQFLHMGPVHLVANLSGLMLVGGYVERRLGLPKFLFIYFISGTTPMLVHVLLAEWDPALHQTSIGASGCLMGLVGATAAVLARGWFEEAVRPAGRPLMTVAAMVAFQALLDIAMPIVDFLGHALGAVAGFTFTAMFLGLRWWRTAVVALPGAVVALVVTRFADSLPWRVPPCSAGETTYCEQSCEMGLMEACAELGRKLTLGEGTNRDLPRARSLLERACSGGVAEACLGLARFYMVEPQSSGTPKAAQLYRQACDGGVQEACRTYGVLLLTGSGVPRDVATGQEFLHRACAAGDQPSCVLKAE